MNDAPCKTKSMFLSHEASLMKSASEILLNFCLQNDVEILANQKVFDQQFVEIFRQNGILVLPRLGTKGISHLSALCGTRQLLTSIGALQSQSIDFCGFIDEITLETDHNDNQRLKLSRKGSNFCSIQIQNWNEDTGSEIEVRFFIINSRCFTESLTQTSVFSLPQFVSSLLDSVAEGQHV